MKGPGPGRVDPHSSHGSAFWLGRPGPGPALGGPSCRILPSESRPEWLRWVEARVPARSVFLLRVSASPRSPDSAFSFGWPMRPFDAQAPAHNLVEKPILEIAERRSRGGFQSLVWTALFSSPSFSGHARTFNSRPSSRPEGGFNGRQLQRGPEARGTGGSAPVPGTRRMDPRATGRSDLGGP
jgi:hypothetical protein